MRVEDAVKLVSEKFVYKSDPKILDYWFIMRDQNGKYYGDCEDFSLTVIYHVCDENLLKFLFYVFILHKYRLYFGTTINDEKHAIGYAQGLFFDNISKEALPQDEFLNKTKNTLYFFFPSPFMIAPMILGLFRRSKKHKTKL